MFCSGPCLAVLVFSVAIIGTSSPKSTHQLENMQIGFTFVSFSNPDGTTADGHCCDEWSKTAGLCSPNMCDVFFILCANRAPQRRCDTIARQATPVMYNNNSFHLGKEIGNGAVKTNNFLIFKMQYRKGSVTMTYTAAEEISGGTGSAFGRYSKIAEFHYSVDWVDPVFNPHPVFTRAVLNDTGRQLVMDFVSQCYEHYYTEDCSVYCKPDNVHYTCLDNGTKHCNAGWEGHNCTYMVDLCLRHSNPCQNGGTCKPAFLTYTCLCLPRYTGHHCEAALLTTTSVSNASTTKPEVPKQYGVSHHPVGYTLALATGCIFSLLIVVTSVCWWLIWNKKRDKITPDEPVVDKLRKLNRLTDQRSVMI